MLPESMRLTDARLGANPCSDPLRYGAAVMEDLGLSRHDVESYTKAMRKYREEQIELLMAGVMFCASELVKEEAPRRFLMKLVEGTLMSLKDGPK